MPPGGEWEAHGRSWEIRGSELWRGTRIGDRRRVQGLTQAQVADGLGVSQQTINSFERGRRRVPVSALPILAELLDMNVEELIVGETKASKKRGPVSRLQKQMDQIRQLPRSKQRLVVEMIEAVLTQAQRMSSS